MCGMVPKICCMVQQMRGMVPKYVAWSKNVQHGAENVCGMVLKMCGMVPKICGMVLKM